MFDRKRAQVWIPTAVVMRAGWKALLRLREAGELRSGGVLLPTSVLAFGSGGILLIDRPKTRRVLGRHQCALLRDKWSLRWLGWLVDGVPPDLFVLPGGLPALSSCMATLVRALGLGELNVSPGSLRAGGATARLQKNLDILRLLHEGRWRNPSSLAHYLQETISWLVMQAVPRKRWDIVEVLEALWPLFSKPPQRHWSAFFTRHRQYVAKARVVKKALASRGYDFSGVFADSDSD